MPGCHSWLGAKVLPLGITNEEREAILGRFMPLWEWWQLKEVQPVPYKHTQPVNRLVLATNTMLLKYLFFAACILYYYCITIFFIWPGAHSRQKAMFLVHLCGQNHYPCLTAHPSYQEPEHSTKSNAPGPPLWPRPLLMPDGASVLTRILCIVSFYAGWLHRASPTLFKYCSVSMRVPFFCLLFLFF